MAHRGLDLGLLGFQDPAQPLVVLVAALHLLFEMPRGLCGALTLQRWAVHRIVIVASEPTVVTHRDNPFVRFPHHVPGSRRCEAAT